MTVPQGTNRLGLGASARKKIVDETEELNRKKGREELNIREEEEGNNITQINDLVTEEAAPLGK